MTPRQLERIELVVNALRENRLATYRANVLALADRIGVDSAQQLRNLLEEQEARLRNAGPSIRDYEQARAVLAALDADADPAIITIRDLPPAGVERAIAASALELEEARTELRLAHQVIAALAWQAPDKRLRVTEEAAANTADRPTITVYVDDATRDRVITVTA